MWKVAIRVPSRLRAERISNRRSWEAALNRKSSTRNFSKHPEARGDLTILLNHIVLGCKFVCSAVNKAGLAKLIGLAGETNVQGEEQKKLDVLSNQVFVKALTSSGRTNILVSEEDEEAIFVPEKLRGRYCVVFDPLDGSSNIDCGVSIGTIFGIYMLDAGKAGTVEDVLKPGTSMVVAGYCMYGSSCTLVLSTGEGVNGFTLDPSLGEFILTHPSITIPKKGKIYSVNEGNAKNWDEPTTRFVEKAKFPKDGSSPKSLRYIGSMVADVHRTLLYGGIFMYPADKKSPSGKLRVLYEVFPMSFLVEQAGGQAFTGKQRALELVPKKIHERSPIFLGSYDDVEEVKKLYEEYRWSLLLAPEANRAHNFSCSIAFVEHCCRSCANYYLGLLCISSESFMFLVTDTQGSKVTSKVYIARGADSSYSRAPRFHDGAGVRSHRD
ncbi:hypothetical protein R1flu_018363 [Riccia fluitans]|uniref:Fructose-1,6-bisphosphatase, cytosolic n=1 Tax=Riccia fluitans TaxID=41844 RepID=A0ABD1ZFM2_9MARC